MSSKKRLTLPAHLHAHPQWWAHLTACLFWFILRGGGVEMEIGSQTRMKKEGRARRVPHSAFVL